MRNASASCSRRRAIYPSGIPRTRNVQHLQSWRFWAAPRLRIARAPCRVGYDDPSGARALRCASVRECRLRATTRTGDVLLDARQPQASFALRASMLVAAECGLLSLGPHSGPASATPSGVGPHPVPRTGSAVDRDVAERRPIAVSQPVGVNERRQPRRHVTRCQGGIAIRLRNNGTHHIAVLTTSPRRRPGRVRSKSMRPIGLRARKTTFCGVTSKWLITSGGGSMGTSADIST